jgi:hypothetical protein
MQLSGGFCGAFRFVSNCGRIAAPNGAGLDHLVVGQPDAMAALAECYDARRHRLVVRRGLPRIRRRLVRAARWQFGSHVGIRDHAAGAWWQACIGCVEART